MDLLRITRRLGVLPEPEWTSVAYRLIAKSAKCFGTTPFMVYSFWRAAPHVTSPPLALSPPRLGAFYSPNLQITQIYSALLPFRFPDCSVSCLHIGNVLLNSVNRGELKALSTSTERTYIPPDMPLPGWGGVNPKEARTARIPKNGKDTQCRYSRAMATLAKLKRKEARAPLGARWARMGKEIHGSLP